MKTTEQVAVDVAVLLIIVSFSDTGAPPCGGAADLSVGGEPPSDVIVWGAVRVRSRLRRRRGGGEASYGACSRMDASFPSPFPTHASISRQWAGLHKKCHSGRSSRACPGGALKPSSCKNAVVCRQPNGTFHVDGAYHNADSTLLRNPKRKV
jgi:hypothetical protein